MLIIDLLSVWGITCLYPDIRFIYKKEFVMENLTARRLAPFSSD